MDYIFHYTSSPYVNKNGIATFFFSVKKKKKLHCIWAFSSVLLLSIVMVFLTGMFIKQINSNSIYQYVLSLTINNDFSL